MKKIIALVLAALMLVTVFAGCGRSVGNTADTEANREPVTFPLEETVNLVVYSQLANYNGELTGWFAEVLKEKFNVTVTIIPDADGVYATRMESGNLGDIVIWGNNGKDYLEAAQNGYLYDWEKRDLLGQYGSYIQENMAAALESNRKISGTGSVYGFGHNVAPANSNSNEAFFYTWDLRYDLYAQLGYPEIKDLDDYYDVLVQMKEICPTGDDGNETYAVSLWPDWDGSMVMYVKSMATAYYGYDEFGGGLYDSTNGNYYAAMDPDGPYVEMLRWFNKLYRAGLLDPDSSSQTFDKMSEKVKNGRTFFSIFNYAGYMTYNTDEHINAGKGMFTVTPDESAPIVYGLNIEGGNRIWSIGSQTKYPEVCMAIINWLCTPEGRLTQDYGPKGVCWDYDENGKTYFTDVGLACKTDTKTDIGALTDGRYTGVFTDCANQMNNTTWTAEAINPESGETYNCEGWESFATSSPSDLELEWREWASDVTGVEVENEQDYLYARDYTVMPGVTFAMATLDDELSFTEQTVNDKVKQVSWNCIEAATEEEFDAILSAGIEELNGLGYQKLVDFYTAEAARKYSEAQAALNA